MRSLAVTLAFVSSCVSVAMAQNPPAPVTPRVKIDTTRVRLDTVKGEVFIASDVDERPEIVWGPAFEYPQDLREKGIQGLVVVQAIIDQGGRVEPESIKIIQSPDSGFERPVRDYMLRAEFRPAKYKGRRVRTLVNIPMNFKISTPN